MSRTVHIIELLPLYQYIIVMHSHFFTILSPVAGV